MEVFSPFLFWGFDCPVVVVVVVGDKQRFFEKGRVWHPAGFIISEFSLKKKKQVVGFIIINRNTISTSRNYFLHPCLYE